MTLLSWFLELIFLAWLGFSGHFWRSTNEIKCVLSIENLLALCLLQAGAVLLEEESSSLAMGRLALTG